MTNAKPPLIPLLGAFRIVELAVLMAQTPNFEAQMHMAARIEDVVLQQEAR
jgi:hypothetical protein